MKVIVAGSRTFDRKEFLGVIIDAMAISNFEVDEIVSGGARGIDTLAQEYADRMGLPCTTFHADWDKHGKAAGPIRNAAMADYADALLLIYDGHSRGSGNMLELARRKGLKIFKVVLNYEEN